MKYCGHLRQSTAITKAIGQLISYEDGKTSLYDALGGNDNFDPTELLCTLTKGITQSVLTLAKNRADYVIDGSIICRASGTYNGETKYVEVTGYPPPLSGVDIIYKSAVTGYWTISEETEIEWGWQNTSGIVGTYTAFGDNSGTRTVAAGEAGTNNINLLLGGLASFELTAANTNTLGDLIISLENANEGGEIILSESFHFEVIPAAVYDSLYSSSAIGFAAGLEVVIGEMPDISELATAASIAELNNLSSAQAQSAAAAAIAGGVTVSDKTGFKLASDGLDSIATTEPAGVAVNFREMIVQLWRRFFKKAGKTSTALKTYKDNGTVATTQTISYVAGEKIVGNAQ